MREALACLLVTLVDSFFQRLGDDTHVGCFSNLSVQNWPLIHPSHGISDVHTCLLVCTKYHTPFVASLPDGCRCGSTPPSGRCNGVYVYRTAAAKRGYLGCWSLKHVQSAVVFDSMTVRSCLRFCWRRNQTIAALTLGTTCACASSLRAARRKRPGRCKRPCIGQDTSICGGSLVYSVYVILQKHPYRQRKASVSADDDYTSEKLVFPAINETVVRKLPQSAVRLANSLTADHGHEDLQEYQYSAEYRQESPLPPLADKYDETTEEETSKSAGRSTTSPRTTTSGEENIDNDVEYLEKEMRPDEEWYGEENDILYDGMYGDKVGASKPFDFGSMKIPDLPQDLYSTDGMRASNVSSPAENSTEGNTTGLLDLEVFGALEMDTAESSVERNGFAFGIVVLAVLTSKPP